MKLWQYIKWIWSYSYCDGCRFTQDDVYTIYPLNKDYPKFYCNKCLLNLINMKESKKEEKVEMKVAKKSAKIKVKTTKKK